MSAKTWDEMKILDLFSGIGGFSLAAQRVYGEIEGGYSEIDKYAKQIYKKHFPGHIDYGDITTIREQELPYFDIITFGFPCQDLSIAGKRTGFNGRRSSLYFEAIRIINAVRPKYFIFENVKGLFSSHEGKDFIAVLQAITDIGYNGQWQLINTKWFLPQNRERIYFIGYSSAEPRPEVFPIGESDRGNYETQGETQREGTRFWSGYPSLRVGGENNKALIAQALAQRDYKGGNNLLQVGSIGEDAEATRVYNTDGIARTIKNGGGMGAKTGLYMLPRGNNPRSFNEELSPSISTSSFEHNAILQHRSNIRRLTPIECERLQGFPDNWTKYGVGDELISDTQRYKCLGNAITVNVAEEIFKKLIGKHK